MKKISAIVLGTCITATAVGCTDTKTGGDVVIPKYEDNAYIQMFADCPPNASSEILIKEYYEAGFTGWVLTEDDAALTSGDENITSSYKNNLELVSKYGDVYIRNHHNYPYNWNNDKETEILAYGGVNATIPKRNITNEFNEIGNVVGFYQSDEPTYDEIDTLVPLAEWHNQYAKDKLFHINLFPSYGSVNFVGHTLEEYVQHHVDTLLAKVEAPKTLGLDNYPLCNSNDGNYIRPSYLSDLLTVSTIAKKHNETNGDMSDITVGFCIQSFVDNGIRDIECKEDISFQTNTCLALGAKYFEYFTYRTVEQMIGLVQNGEKREVYDYVKEVNEEIKKWDHVIMAFDWLGVKTIAGQDEHENKTSFDSVAEKELQELQSIESIESRLDTLVGEFVDKDGNYGYMLVNYTEPTNHKIGYVDITLMDAKKALVYQGGEEKVYDVIDNRLQLRIEAGDAAFVILCR